MAKVHLERGSVRPPIEGGSTNCIRLDAQVADEGGMRRAKSDEFQDLLDDGAPKRLFDLPVRVVVTIDGATLTQERDRVPVVRAREQPDVIDLRNPTREQLDGARCYVSIIVLADRGVVRAVQLMDIDADGMSVRKDPIDAAALFVDLRRQGSHLSGLEDAIEIGPHWIPSWQSSIVN